MREPPKLSLMGTCFLVLIGMDLARLRDQIIPFWMYPYGADAGSEAIVNQKQHQPSRPGGPAATIQNGSELASTYSVEQQALKVRKNHKKGRGLNCVFGNFFFNVLDNCSQIQSLK